MTSQEITSQVVQNLCEQLSIEVVQTEIVKAVKHLIGINFVTRNGLYVHGHDTDFLLKFMVIQH